MLQDETVSWDPATIRGPLPVATRVYLLYLLVALTVVVVRMIRLWIAAPPFRLNQPRVPSDFPQRLKISASSFSQWMNLTLLACGLFASVTIQHIVAKFDDVRNSLWMFLLRDVSEGTTFGLFVAITLFLARWHVLKRIEFLDQQAAFSAGTKS